MIELEDTITANVGDIAEVDGHDIGSGETNIFILTNEPRAAFERIKQFLGTRDFMPSLKVAFRRIGDDEFAILYPSDLSTFEIA